MTRKSIVRAALVIAAGFMVFTGTPASAAPAESTGQGAEAGTPLKLVKPAKPRAKVADRARRTKASVHRASKSRVAAKKPQKAAEKASAQAGISDTVANAKAEMPQAEARGTAEVTPQAPETAQLDVAASEQLSELDRAANAAPDEGQPRAIRTELVKDDQAQATMPVTVADNAQAFPAPPLPQQSQSASAASASGDAWAQSSLIGKIFIAFGGLLTLASAARMLIA